MTLFDRTRKVEIKTPSGCPDALVDQAFEFAKPLASLHRWSVNEELKRSAYHKGVVGRLFSADQCFFYQGEAAFSHTATE